MIGEALTKDALEDVVEESDAGARVKMEQPLAEVRDPVLLVVAHCVDGAQRAALLIRERDVVTRKPDTFSKPIERPTVLSVPRSKTSTFFSRKAPLEEHFEGVLEMQKHGSLTTVIVHTVVSRVARRKDEIALVLRVRDTRFTTARG